MAGKTKPKKPENRGKSGRPLPPVEHRFKPGQSGNPGGRPKKRLIDEVLTELLEAGHSEAAAAIAKKLVEKAKKGDSKIAQLIAERTQGRPTLKVQHVGDDEAAPIRHLIRFVNAKPNA